MHDDPRIDLNSVQDLDPAFFTTCGRALFVAQHFETNLRAIAAALGIRSAHASGRLPLSDEDELDEFCKTKLKRSLGEVILYALPTYLPPFLVEDLKKHMLPSLDEARKARNRIAHEFLFAIEEMQVSPDVFEELTGSLREDVHVIADADFTVCCMIQAFNKAPLPTCRGSYVSKIVSWVFDLDEQQLQGG